MQETCHSEAQPKNLVVALKDDLQFRAEILHFVQPVLTDSPGDDMLHEWRYTTSEPGCKPIDTHAKSL